MPKGSFFTVESIGPKRKLTPEGFLLCEEVPIARTGVMIYGPDETPIEPGPDGIVKIFRDAEDVFSPATIASANGKSVTTDHPEDDVSPENWQQLSHGVAMNVRRGEGASDDLLFADLLITTPEGIKFVQEDGIREISLGYDADYEETGPGIGRQSNLIVNHIALVEQGRCGFRCAIGDKKHANLGDTEMATKAAKRSKILDALMRAFKAKDSGEVEQLANEVTEDTELLGGEGTHIHIHSNDDTPEPGSPIPGNPTSGSTSFTDEDMAAFVEQNNTEHAEMRARLDALEQALAATKPVATDEIPEELVEAIKDEVPEELKEEAAKAKDSAYLSESFRDTIAQAEILVPGIKIPTFDRASKPGDTVKNICSFRRTALDLAYVQPNTRGILDELLAGKTLDTKNMTCDAIRTLFRSAAATQRTLNNAGGRAHDGKGVSGKPALTLAELNRRNAATYGSK
jgi:uncharacterized protein